MPYNDQVMKHIVALCLLEYKYGEFGGLTRDTVLLICGKGSRYGKLHEEVQRLGHHDMLVV